MNLVAADREGQELGSDSMSVFKECDSLHYLRNGGYYSETIKLWNLATHLSPGNSKHGKFRIVVVDMILEQDLQCVSRGLVGIT